MSRNKIVVNLMLLTLVINWSCSPKLSVDYERSGQVVAVDYDDLTITLSAPAVGGDIKQAVDYAERQILENLLFKGIPKSNQEQPLIDDEQQAWLHHDGYLRSLIIEKKYSKFLISSYSDSQRKRSGTVQVVQVVKWDLNALRRELENQGVIRKFGL